MGFFDAAGGGIIGGAISLISNLFSNHQQAKENDRQRTFAHNEAILAHNRQMNAFREQNEYNSPLNQANLLKEAGFNPASLLGSSGATVGRSSQSPPTAQASAPSVGSYRPLLDPQMIVALSQASLNDAQAQKTKAETGYVNEQKIGQSISNSLDEIRLGLEKQFANTRYQLELQKLDWNIAKASAETSLLKINRELGFDELVHMRPLEAMNYVADTTVKSTQSLVNQALHAKTEQDRKNSIEQLFATLNLTGSQIALNYANADATKVNADNWRSGSGVLWHISNKDKWLRHYDVNTSLLEHNIYQTFLKSYKNQILTTYGQQAMSDLFNSRYAKDYNWLLSQPGVKSAAVWFLPNPQTGYSNFSISQGASAGARIVNSLLNRR